MKNDLATKTQLDNHLLFHFRFIKKSKKVTDEFINYLQEISKYTIGQIMQSSREQVGYSTIEIGNTKLSDQISDEFINFILKKHNIKLENKLKKYDYIRVGKVQRLYGKIYDGVFYPLLYEHDKKNQ